MAGCEFSCEAYYGSVLEIVQNKAGKLIVVRDCDYFAMGLHEKSLKALKKSIQEVNG